MLDATAKLHTVEQTLTGVRTPTVSVGVVVGRQLIKTHVGGGIVVEITKLGQLPLNRGVKGHTSGGWAHLVVLVSHSSDGLKVGNSRAERVSSQYRKVWG